MGLYTQNEAARVAVERELRVAGVKPKGNSNGQPALTVEANGNGQPAVTAKANGNGKAPHAGNGHDKSERTKTDERQPESAPPVV